MDDQHYSSEQEVQNTLSTAIQHAQQLELLLSKLTENNTTAQELESLVIPSEYLQLLGTIAYTENCIVHSYGHIKQKQVPPQFKEVKTYYQKVQEALKPAEKPEKKINTEVVNRIIKRNIKM